MIHRTERVGARSVHPLFSLPSVVKQRAQNTAGMPRCRGTETEDRIEVRLEAGDCRAAFRA